MKFRTVLIESPARLSCESGYLVVRCSDGQTSIHLSEIRAVVVVSQQTYISAYLMAELAERKIALTVSDRKSNPVGQLLPLCGCFNSSKRIQEQLQWGEVPKKQVWRFVVQEKIRQQASVLDACGKGAEAKHLIDLSRSVKSADSDNREAVAARFYFMNLFGKDFSRKDGSPVNAALNYGYAILLSMFNQELVGKGCLTQCGIHHKNPTNNFNLSCDFMEPFRPVVDRLVHALNVQEFTLETKHHLHTIPEVELFYKDGRFALRSVIDAYLSDCIKVLNAEMSVEDLAGIELL